MKYVVYICKNETECRKILYSFYIKHKDENIKLDKFSRSILFKDTRIKKLFIYKSNLSFEYLRGYFIEKFYAHTALTEDETKFLNSRLNKTK